MAKKKSAKGDASKKEKAPVPAQADAKPRDRPLIRAIRVSQDVLEAAKAYKKAKGVNS